MRDGVKLRARGTAEALLRRRPRPEIASAVLAVGGGAAALSFLIEATAATDALQAWGHAGGAIGALFLATLGGLGLASTRTRGRARDGGRARPLAPRTGSRPRAASARADDAARLALGVLLLAAAFALLIDGAATTLGLDEGDRAERPAPEGGLDPRGTEELSVMGPRGSSPRLVDPDGDPRGALPSNLLSTAPVLEVRRVAGAVDPAESALHLRGFVLEGFGRDGAPASSPGAPLPIGPDAREAGTRGGDAVVDPFEEARAADAEFTLELTPLVRGDGTVFAPSPLLALEEREATLESARALLRSTPGAPATVVSGLRSTAGLANAAARGSVPPDSPWLALPDAVPGSTRAAALDRIAEFARESAGRAASAGPDLARVLGVVRRLRTEFGYDLVDTSFPTPIECAALLERRTGSCTHFATTAMLALRSMEIPCRVAAGYIAREDTGDGAWLVRARDGHAWVEVHFEGLGWWTFDPTPPASGVANPAWAPLEISGARPRGIAALVRRLAEDAGRWLGGLRVLGALVAAAALGAAAARALRRRRSRATEPSAGDGDPRPPIRASAGERLESALRAHGFAQGPSEPPLEFARRADASLAVLAPGGAIERSVAALLRSDAHGVDLPPDAASRIESLSDALARASTR